MTSTLFRSTVPQLLIQIFDFKWDGGLGTVGSEDNELLANRNQVQSALEVQQSLNS